MKIAIHQPNYIPWCGFFAKMLACDTFVLLDDAEMPGGQSYVYRTQVWNGSKVQWLSIPTSYHLGDSISSVVFADRFWPRKHFNTLANAYARCAYRGKILAAIEPVYREPGGELAEFNIRLIRTVMQYLGITKPLVRSSSLELSETGDDRLIAICRALEAREYLSGKGGTKYQDPEKFARAGIHLDVQEYQPASYKHVSGQDLRGLSVLDALFHLGPETIHLLNYERAWASCA